jgi:hypothetical protein
MFTRLENAVLDMMLDKPGEEFKTARQQLAHATVSKRDLAVLGFLQIWSCPPTQQSHAIRRIWRLVMLVPSFQICGMVQDLCFPYVTELSR